LQPTNSLVGANSRDRHDALAPACCHRWVSDNCCGQRAGAVGRPRTDALSLEQKTKISQLITKQTAPLASSSFSIAIDSVVPADIEVHALPAAAEQVAPQVRGYGYVVVEEQIALVEPRSRKVEIVFPRWREP
jgi:uncharacterized NAD-dependent epimerase/dehydratase family protein